MDLPTFVASEGGDIKFAKKYKVSVRAARSYREEQRKPKPSTARRIVKLSDKAITLDDIYA